MPQFASTIGECSLFTIIKLRRIACYIVIIGLQDRVGDTALHDALSKENTTIIELLLATKKARLELQNAKGFNAVHQAALHGHHA
jgi:ankyrin repeat protein